MPLLHSREEMVPVCGWLPGTGVLPIRRGAENAEQLTSAWKGLEPHSGPCSTPLHDRVKTQKEGTLGLGGSPEPPPAAGMYSLHTATSSPLSVVLRRQKTGSYLLPCSLSCTHLPATRILL